MCLLLFSFARETCFVYSYIARKNSSVKMSEEISEKHITKLNTKNFQTWKFQVRALLIAKGVNDIVNGERMLPDNTDANAALDSR